ncbi:nucleoside diphosphate kinase regulator [Devosia nitrariae]|uniref:Nucleoside diphosphate kinase regulator n=1 Tax=Devosia nitrariae TaxID=2071872 RepID=A0ABQ5W1N9_9HYPH|nr:nucleoside diphosphate kinase regulator [Devosia nitrariae]GLQ53726.1 nucleoside diphosphate kinase regulator [Devosia nitrariae]
MRTHTLRPTVTLAQSEHAVLLALAARGGGALASAAESLMNELERARVVPDARLPADVVRMGSHVQYRTDRDEVLDVTLVYPEQADIAEGRVSVLTPVGAALIGLRTGQSITWESRDGRKHVLTVTSVIQPSETSVEA